MKMTIVMQREIRRAGLAGYRCRTLMCLTALIGWLASALSVAMAANGLERDYTHVVSTAAEPPPTVHRRGPGPFFEYVRWRDGRTFRALRPFYSRVSNPIEERSQMDLLWPLGSWRTRGAMNSGRLGIAFWQDFDSDDPGSQSRLWIPPLFFSGRSRGGETYTAVFPVAGRLHDFFGRDTVRFVLFPVYADSRRGEVETWHVLWPLFSVTRGENRDRLRLFPFYGQAVEPGGTTRRFVLWPLWSSVRRENSADDGSGFVLFPLLGSVRTRQQRSLMLLPPLFRYSVNPAGTEMLFPWPILQRSTGRVEKMYVWPLWGRKTSGPVSSGFFLWPLGRIGKQERGDTVAVQRTFFPLYYSRQILRQPAENSEHQPAEPTSAPPPRTAEAEPESPAAEPSSDRQEPGLTIEKYQKVWPLYSYQRDEQTTVLRLPDLWPGRPFVPIERNYAPFWTLYWCARTAEAREQEFLWGLFHRRVAGDGSRHTRIFPLLAWENDPDAGLQEVSVLLGLLRFGRQDGRRYAKFFSSRRRDPEKESP